MIHFWPLVCCLTASWVTVVVACDQPLVGCLVRSFVQRSTIAVLDASVSLCTTSGGDTGALFGLVVRRNSVA